MLCVGVFSSAWGGESYNVYIYMVILLSSSKLWFCISLTLCDYPVCILCLLCLSKHFVKLREHLHLYQRINQLRADSWLILWFKRQQPSCRRRDTKGSHVRHTGETHGRNKETHGQDGAEKPIHQQTVLASLSLVLNLFSCLLKK